MRRALLALVLLASSLLLIPSATAHGTCTLTANRPSVSLSYSGQYVCINAPIHTTVTLTVSLMRRQVGGSWVQISSVTDTEGPTNRNYTGVITGFARDCRKDYSTRATGSASGGHSAPTKFSTFLFHSC